MAQFEILSDEAFSNVTIKPTQPSPFSAESAHYNAAEKGIMIRLSNGISTLFPLDKLPGLAQAKPEDLQAIVVEGKGYGLHIPALDADISVAQLFADYFASDLMLKKLRRSQASRANGRQGGRPAKKAVDAA
jgi:hypothetical protein